MSALGRVARPAIINALVENNGSADASPNSNVENRFVVCACSPERFGQAGCVGVIIKPRGNAVGLLDFREQGKIRPAWQVWTVYHDSLAKIERARRRHPDGINGKFRVGIDHCLNRVMYAVYAIRSAAARIHRYARVAEDLTRRVHQSRGDFAPPDINP